MTAVPSRRRFLKTSCLTAVAVSLTVCGGGALVLTYPPSIDQPTGTFGEENQGTRVLVAYATKAGSTAEAAARIAETLAERGAWVDLLPVKSVTDISPYSAVIVGSAIRMGSVLPEVMTFVQNQQAALAQITFYPFILCSTASEPGDASMQTAAAYLDPVRALITPAAEGVFAGAVIPEKLPLLDRLITSAMKSPTGDFRDWDLITTWANEVAATTVSSKRTTI